MENSFKLKIQASARGLRKEQQKLYNMLNRLEESSTNFDFFDPKSDAKANGSNNFDDEAGEFQQYAVEEVNDHQSEEIQKIVKGISTLTN